MSTETQSFMMREVIEETTHDFHPHSFNEYVGQKALKEKLSTYAHAAHLRQEPLDHVLLFGPPGLGKTTLSMLLARVMGVTIKVCSGPTLERSGDIVSILSSLEPRDVLFIDEIHRLPVAVEEILYNAMEHFRIDIIVGQGAGAKSVNLPIHPFTLIGATTKTGLISAPLRTRFGIIEKLDFYTDQELQQIIQNYAEALNIKISLPAALQIAKCARGTPRVAKKIVRRIRDFAQVHNNNEADDALVRQGLEFLGIDNEGLSTLDNMYLKTLIERFGGGPVGLETIAAVIGEDSHMLEEVQEPFLLRMGYIERSPRGRKIAQAKLPQLQLKFFGQKQVF